MRDIDVIEHLNLLSVVESIIHSLFLCDKDATYIFRGRLDRLYRCSRLILQE